MYTDTKNEATNSTSRIDYEGNLSPVVSRLCEEYSAGDPILYSPISTGYEDYNVYIETNTGKYVAKIFSKDRTEEDILRYTEIMETVIRANINHPPLLKTQNNEYVFKDSKAKNISMVLMNYVEGKSFMELGRIPSDKELDHVLEQAAKINALDYKPKYIFDSWAITNNNEMFEKVKGYLSPEDLQMVEIVLKNFSKIPTWSLPHCFVHGDFTKANIIKGHDGKIYVLDFSVSNRYPRIQELAVISANLMNNPKGNTNLRETIKKVVEKYEKYQKLTKGEKTFIYIYSLAGMTMELMGAYQEKYLNGNNSEETDFWLDLGREGLRRELKGNR